MVVKSLQTILITVLNAVYSITRHINVKVRDAIVQILWFVLCAYFILVRSGYYKQSFLAGFLPTRSGRYIFCTIILVIIGLFSINGRLKLVPWRKIVIIPQIIIGASTIIISFIHPVGDGYRLFGFQLLLIFPALYLIWNNRRDYDHIFKQIIYAMTFSGLILFFITFIVAYDGMLVVEPNGRVMGIMVNSNCFSLVGLELVLGGIYLIVSERKSGFSIFYEYACIGIGIGIITLGQMRIAVIATIICILVSTYYYLKNFRNRINKRSLVCLFAGFLIILLSIELCGMIKTVNNKAAIGDTQPISSEEEAAKQEEGKSVVDRLLPEEKKDLNSYSSGRLVIWEKYWERLNWLGNNYDEYNPEEMGVPSVAQYAHNYFLEISYRLGVPIGILMTIYIFFCGVICLRYLFFDTKEASADYKLLSIMFMIVFSLETVLDCALLPFFQIEALLFYLSAMVMVDNRV